MEIVHPVPAEEASAWLATMATALLGSSTDADFARRVARTRAVWQPEWVWGVRERERWVGTFWAEPSRITVPGGGDIEIDAVTRVSVAATHRRRGLLREMMTQSLQAARDRGTVASALIAAEWPIYGRFGYAPATRVARYTLHTHRPGAELAADPSGTVRAATPTEAATLGPAILRRVRGSWAGQLARADGWWQRHFGIDGFEPLEGTPSTWVVHESVDGPDGLLVWKPIRDFTLSGDLGAVEVSDFLAGSDRAYRNLWAYLAGLDLVDDVMLAQRPLDEAVRWLLPDGRALRTSYVADHTWLRLLDVPAALSARGYSGPGQLTVEVIDNHGGYAAGTYLLETDGATATCRRTDASADLRVAQSALSAVYLGDQSFRSLLLGGGIDELVPGALARADALFATPLRPWNATSF